MALHEKKEGQPFLDVADTVYISGYVYPKTKAAESTLNARLQEAGYTLKGDNFATLENIHKAQCSSCKSVIESQGVACHGHKCEVCHKPTYIKWCRGGIIEFYFIRDGELVKPTVAFRIHQYRPKTRELILYAEPLTEATTDYRPRLFSVRNKEQAVAAMEETKDLYRRFTANLLQGPTELIAIPHVDGGLLTEESRINTCELTGSIQRYRSVKVFDGKVYDDFFGELPIPDSLHVASQYADGSKLSLAQPNAHEVIIRAAGQVSRADYYYQDGRPAFDRVHYQRWCSFVKHFVDVDFDDWVGFLMTAPTDGPGFIRGLAAFCGAMSDGQARHVSDESNIGNALVGASKLTGGFAGFGRYAELKMRDILRTIPEVREAIAKNPAIAKTLARAENPFDKTAREFAARQTESGMTGDEIERMIDGAAELFEEMPEMRDVFATFPELRSLANLSIGIKPEERKEKRPARRRAAKRDKGRAP